MLLFRLFSLIYNNGSKFLLNLSGVYAFSWYLASLAHKFLVLVRKHQKLKLKEM